MPVLEKSGCETAFLLAKFKINSCIFNQPVAEVAY